MNPQNRLRLGIPIAIFAALIMFGLLVLSGKQLASASNTIESLSSSANLQDVRQQPNRLYDFPEPLLDRLNTTNLAAQPAVAPTRYTEYVRVTDNLESMFLQIPLEWSDIQTGTWTLRDREVGIYIQASTDLNRFSTSDEPGVFFGVSRELAGTPVVNNPAHGLNPAIERLLSDEKQARANRCQHNGRFSYQDNFYQGEYDLFVGCANGRTEELVFATMPAQQSYIMLLRINVQSADDLYAATRILETYQVLNSSLEDEHDDHEEHQH